MSDAQAVFEDVPTKMSGRNLSWGGGATRDSNAGKPRYEMSPPAARKRVAMVYARGAVNRGALNFAQGMPVSRCLESAMRHIEQARAGETDEDHFAQAVWNLEVAMHFQGSEWDDLFDWTVPPRPPESQERLEAPETAQVTPERPLAEAGRALRRPRGPQRTFGPASELPHL